MTTKRTTQFTPPVDAQRYTRRNVTVPFNEITEAGAYYFHSTGWLYRVPDDSLSLGHSPTMNICSAEECFVTKISDDPWIPLNKAREICSNWDFSVNF
jgi:hypothetical protein